MVATVSKEAKYKVDGTDMGFKPVRLVSGKDAASPVQSTCKMERPGELVREALRIAERSAWNFSWSRC